MGMEEDGIVGKLLGAWNEAFKSTCRCFDMAGAGGGVGALSMGAGGKSVTSGGVGMGATIMETVNDTTATIANTLNNMSNKSPPTNNANGKNASSSNNEPPTFSKPMEMT